METSSKGYLSLAMAAKYCGNYTSRYFRELANKHNIPRYGSANNKFMVDDLDIFMHDSNFFINNVSRQGSSYSPVTHAIITLKV